MAESGHSGPFGRLDSLGRYPAIFTLLKNSVRPLFKFDAGICTQAVDQCAVQDRGRRPKSAGDVIA